MNIVKIILFKLKYASLSDTELIKKITCFEFGLKNKMAQKDFKSFKHFNLLEVNRFKFLKFLMILFYRSEMISK